MVAKGNSHGVISDRLDTTGAALSFTVSDVDWITRSEPLDASVTRVILAKVDRLGPVTLEVKGGHGGVTCTLHQASSESSRFTDHPSEARIPSISSRSVTRIPLRIAS